MITTRRLNAFAAMPALIEKWLDFGKAVQNSGLAASLMEPVKIRASQINGCAMCLHMHTRGCPEAAAAGGDCDLNHSFAGLEASFCQPPTGLWLGV
jgi:AhpD family alkylhydroperoxidase